MSLLLIAFLWLAPVQRAETVIPLTVSTNPPYFVLDSGTFSDSPLTTSNFTPLMVMTNGDLVVEIHTNGSVEFGRGFTADAAAKEFWRTLGREWKNFCPCVTNSQADTRNQK